MHYRDKVLTIESLCAVVREERTSGKNIVFTNGCFDLLHVGHVRLLAAARQAGDLLVVGVNSDASVRRLKGAGRPLVPQGDRAEVLAALEAVDLVTIFDQDTPAELIAALEPDVLVKGGDWRPDRIIGREIVERRGGHVLIVPTVEGFSTTTLAERIRRGG